MEITNTQLWIGVAVPSLLIVLAWLQTNVRLTDFQKKTDGGFARVEARLTRLEGDYREFYGMEKKLEGRVDGLSRR